MTRYIAIAYTLSSMWSLCLSCQVCIRSAKHFRYTNQSLSFLSSRVTCRVTQYMAIQSNIRTMSHSCQAQYFVGWHDTLLCTSSLRTLPPCDVKCLLEGDIMYIAIDLQYTNNTIQIFLFPIKEPIRVEQLTKNLIQWLWIDYQPCYIDWKMTTFYETNKSKFNHTNHVI